MIIIGGVKVNATDSEILSLSKFLDAETYSLAIARTSIMAISDEELKSLSQSGIKTAEARIIGLQQFIRENQIAPANSETQSQ